MASSLGVLEHKYEEILAQEKAIRKKLDMIRQEQNRQARKQARKARNHELYQAAGLMILAGLVDTKTGKPTRDTAELLGALVWLATIEPDEERQAAWRERGSDLLAKA